MMPFQFMQSEPSEEEKQEMLRQYMKMVDFHNGLQRWMKSMTAHQLYMLRVIFGTIARSPDPSGAALLHEGLMIGHLQHKDECEECGVNHLLAEMEAKNPFPQMQPPAEPAGPDVPGVLPPDLHKMSVEPYKIYHVTPLTDNPQDLRVRCTGRNGKSCHMQWPTFADREANAGPEDCPGCNAREGHG
jgi:hypothetical protein